MDLTPCPFKLVTLAGITGRPYARFIKGSLVCISGRIPRLFGWREVEVMMRKMDWFPGRIQLDAVYFEVAAEAG